MFENVKGHKAREREILIIYTRNGMVSLWAVEQGNILFSSTGASICCMF